MLKWKEYLTALPLQIPTRSRGPDLAPRALPLGGGSLHPDGRGRKEAQVLVGGQGQEARTVQSPPEGE